MSDMDSRQRQEAESLGYGRIRKLLHSATLLYEGWDMDNAGWIVELEDGSRAAMTTNHGYVCLWSRAEAEAQLAEAEASAASIRKALELWPGE